MVDKKNELKYNFLRQLVKLQGEEFMNPNTNIEVSKLFEVFTHDFYKENKLKGMEIIDEENRVGVRLLLPRNQLMANQLEIVSNHSGNYTMTFLQVGKTRPRLEGGIWEGRTEVRAIVYDVAINNLINVFFERINSEDVYISPKPYVDVEKKKFTIFRRKKSLEEIEREAMEKEFKKLHDN